MHTFNSVVRLVALTYQIRITREMLVGMESSIIRVLDFNFINLSPVEFLERYERLLEFRIRNHHSCKHWCSEALKRTARQLCMYMQQY